MKNSFYQYTYLELMTMLELNALSSSGASLLFNWHYKKKKLTPCRDNLSLATQQFVAENFDFYLPEIIEIQHSFDQTVKLLLRLSDGQKVETVLIPFQNKYTACLSSQVGCAMQCSFCFTGTQGLKRHLSCDEMIGQFLVADRWLIENIGENLKLKNIVFMGQGEPLHNFDAVKKACQIFLDQHGTSIGLQKITVSTAGHLPGLLRWKQEMPRVNLALSLHSSFEHIRNELIPINQRYPLEQVLTLIDDIPLSRKQYVIYEYLLIKNLNDSPLDARGVGELLKEKRAIINLIAFNPFPSSGYERPDNQVIIEFKKILDTYNIPTLIRGTKGDDILAACGQLNTKS